MEYEEKFKLIRVYLNIVNDWKNQDKKYLTIYSQLQIYISACSNVVNPIIRYPIIMSIILHHYKILKEPTSSLIAFLIFLKIMMTIIFMTIIVTFIILHQEWYMV
jgi:hypothetical protein